MDPVQFDGSAAGELRRNGIAGLRKRRGSGGKVGPYDIDRLHAISADLHKSVPRQTYYECARNLRAQSLVTLGHIRSLEVSEKGPLRERRIAQQRALYENQRTDAATAKAMGYARRSTLHHWIARLVPKDRRPHFFLALTMTGFAINLLWLMYLVKVHSEHAKARHATRDNRGGGDAG